MNAQPAIYRDMLDIIFEHKNKNYGAYQIRREYPKILVRVAAYFFGGLAAVFALPFLMASFSGVFPKKEKAREVEVVLERKIEIEKPTPPKIDKISAPKPPSLPAMQKLVQLVLVKNTVSTTENPPDMTEILKSPALVGPADQTGEPGPIEVPESFGKGIVETHQTKIVEPDTVFTVVEKAPAFPGGEAELFKYLNKNIKYPPLARETGVQGYAILSFLVGKSGKIEDVKIIKDPGAGLGKEAARVVRAMPNWNAGEQGGNAVKVRFTLPVRFKLD